MNVLKVSVIACLLMCFWQDFYHHVVFTLFYPSTAIVASSSFINYFNLNESVNLASHRLPLYRICAVTLPAEVALLTFSA